MPTKDKISLLFHTDCKEVLFFDTLMKCCYPNFDVHSLAEEKKKKRDSGMNNLHFAVTRKSGKAGLAFFYCCRARTT